MITTVDNINLFAESILNHCLDISRGECSITEENIMDANNELESQVLFGLLCMHEEIVSSSRNKEEKLKVEMESRLLKDKNRELEQFAYKASHDLKEPIRTIFSFSQLLKNTVEDIDPKAQSYIDYIQMSAKRMTDMISHLLEYARFGNQTKFKNFDAHILMQTVNLDLITQLQRVEGKLILSDLPKINGDETLIRLLFQNLISNALKFQKEDVNPVVEISSETNEDFYTFIIKDNGVGIDEKDMPVLFDIFARGNKDNSEFEGSGIGLAHCKKIVELHQGEIWCESVVNHGSTFYFTISRKLEVDENYR